MAIAFDNAAGQDSASSTMSYTCTGSNLILLVGIYINNSASDSVSAVTYNSVSMTRVAIKTDGAESGYLYYLINPSTGSNTISMTHSNQIGTALAASYTGTNQSSQPDSHGEGEQTNGTFTQSTTVVASNCWLVGMFTGDSGNDITAGTGTTRRVRPGNQAVWMDSNATVGTGSQSLVGTLVTANHSLALIASIAPVASAVVNTGGLLMASLALH
jgi:hypothetical protein